MKRIKYVGCFEQVVVPGRALAVAHGETIEVTDDEAGGLMANPGQWELVDGVASEKAPRKGVK
jgi:hypothetical protein